MEFSWLEIAVGVGIFLAGLAVGLLGPGRGSAIGARVRELEADLRSERERQEAYRQSVVKHFERTSELFRDLTQEYTSLYAHLAEGARDLCPDAPPALARGLDAPALGLRAHASEAEAPAESEASTAASVPAEREAR